MSQGCNDGKEMYKKAWCTCKVVVLSIKTFYFNFLPFFLRRRCRWFYCHLENLLPWWRDVTLLLSIKITKSSRVISRVLIPKGSDYDLPYLKFSLNSFSIFLHSPYSVPWPALKFHYYSFKIFPRFWLAKTTRIIHHNQLMMTKFGRILRLIYRWRQKCSFLAG